MEDILNQLSVANKKRFPMMGDRREINQLKLSEFGNALAGEAGELCNIIKKIERGDQFYWEKGTEYILDKKAIAKESADVVIYLELLCQRAGVSLREAIVSKFNSQSEDNGIEIYLDGLNPNDQEDRDYKYTDEDLPF